MRQSFQFKLFECKRLKHLHGTINVSAQIWNHAVALHWRYYRIFKKTFPKAKLQAHLAKLRNGRYSHWQAVGSQSVQAIADRLYLAWDAFFEKRIKRPPTFCKRRNYRSFTLKQAGYKLLGHGRIKILGRAYRFTQSRAITGLIKTVNIRRDAIGAIYITFSCDQVPQTQLAPKTGKSAGADFGLKDFLTLSNGEKIAAPQPLKMKLRHLRKAHRIMSRKQKGSKSRKKARLAVARIHKKVRNIRSDWQWKAARELVTAFDELTFETLNLRAMKQLWGRKVSDLGFSDFLLKTEWVARKLGKDFAKIGPWTPTTKRCSCCRHLKDVPLNVRVFACERCGHTECRDLNAAKSILEEGRLLRSEAARKTSQEASGVITAESHAL